MTLKLTISAKKSDSKTNYIPFNTDRTFIESQLKEVKASSFNKVGIYVSTLGVGLMPGISHAQTNLNTESLSSQTVFAFSMKMSLIALGISFGAAMIFSIIAGMMRYLGGERNRRKSKEWTTDIIKGFIQCLVAIPTVYALYYLATTIFGELNFSNNTFLNFP